MPVKSTFRLIPNVPVISLLSMPARTQAPTLVLSWNHQSRNAISSPKPMRKNRYTGRSMLPTGTEPERKPGIVAESGYVPQIHCVRFWRM